MENCIKGKHTLTDIMSVTHWDESQQVVRWCTVCGSVVIDVDFDGRTKPGDALEMQFSDLFKEKFEEYKKREKETSTCSKCGVKAPFVMTIDQWAIIDGEEYCLSCQKNHKVGWYEPKKLEDEN